MIFAGNFAVQNYLPCDGRLLSIAQNTALFPLLGTTYGGNGINTFGLPNLNGRMPIGMGQLSGGSTYVLGQMSGSESVTLLASQMPAHTHNLNVAAAGTSTTPVGNVLAAATLASNEEGVNAYAPTATATAAGAAIGVAGGSQPVGILSPYLALNFQICVSGIYPSRP